MVKPNEHLIIRIDGKSFSKFTKGFKQPFDIVLRTVMALTTQDLVKEFNVYTGYTQSDEITLFIPSLKDNTVDNDIRIKHGWTHMYNGRVQKIASLVASYCSTRFNYHLANELIRYMAASKDSVERDNCSKLYHSKLNIAYFDARVFGVPNNEEVFNIFMWRTRDCIKNSKSMFAQAYCSHKSLQNKNGEEQIEYCLQQTGNDWNVIDDKFKYGILVKRELYEVPDINPNIEYNTGFVSRRRFIQFSKDISKFDIENVDLICRQYR
jgi:tRNA(His) 5'-end guanylyltransferase